MSRIWLFLIGLGISLNSWALPATEKVDDAGNEIQSILEVVPPVISPPSPRNPANRSASIVQEHGTPQVVSVEVLGTPQIEIEAPSTIQISVPPVQKVEFVKPPPVEIELVPVPLTIPLPSLPQIQIIKPDPKPPIRIPLLPHISFVSRPEVTSNVTHTTSIPSGSVFLHNLKDIFNTVKDAFKEITSVSVNVLVTPNGTSVNTLVNKTQVVAQALNSTNQHLKIFLMDSPF